MVALYLDREERQGRTAKFLVTQKRWSTCPPFLNLPPMKAQLCSVTIFAVALFVRAEALSPIPLWPDGAPGALGKEDKDVPTLTPFLAESSQASGAAMVILPGGGYGGLAPHEGK